MIIEKFEHMTSEKYRDLTLVERKIFQFYREMKENNYSEITISDFSFSHFTRLYEYISTFKILNINKINYAVNTTSLLERFLKL